MNTLESNIDFYTFVAIEICCMIETLIVIIPFDIC